MKLHRIRHFEQYREHVVRTAPELAAHHAYLDSHTPKGRDPFKITGYSYTAGKQVAFDVDYQHAGETAGVLWRERVCCPETFFNNRMRATFHLFDQEMEPYSDLDLYVTEQVTPIYRYFADRFPAACGSEFLGDRIPYGSINANGIRNENLCRLTFKDDSFDAVVSLDVLEHIPDYPSAFLECARVLKPGGKMMWSVPFAPNSHKNLIRARIVNGQIVHDMPPQYHGDPLSSEGVLCFQIFGWEMLDQAKAAGFRDAYAICFHSIEFGYLGGEQFMFFAVK